MNNSLEFHLVDSREKESKPIIPKRSTRNSAGYDMYSPMNHILEPGKLTMIKTDIKCDLDSDMWLMLVIRSSLASRGVELVNSVGVVDADYYNNPENEGNIIAMLRNNSDEPIDISQGERIVQGIILNYYTTASDNVTAERKGGIGSTNTFKK